MFQACVVKFGSQWDQFLHLDELPMIIAITPEFMWHCSRPYMVGVSVLLLGGLSPQRLVHMA